MADLSFRRTIGLRLRQACAGLGEALRRTAIDGFRDLLLLAGVALLGYGASLVYWPAGFLAAGATLIYVAIFGVR